MARRKRIADTPVSRKESCPAKRATKKSADPDAATDEQEAAAAAAQLQFSDLPFHFLVKMAGKMTYDEMAIFRLSCKQAHEAVAHWGRSQRALNIKQLLTELWPELKPDLKCEGDAERDFDSLHQVKKLMAKLSALIDFDLITSIDFDGFVTIHTSQLEAIFGTAPRTNVKAINLAGTILMADGWAMLARLFPAVKTIRYSDAWTNFPEEITREMALKEDVQLAPHILVDQRALVGEGQLDKERVLTLRCIKRLFPKAQHMHIDT